MEKKQSLYAVANRVNKNHEDEINKLYVAVKEKASTYDALAQMIDLLADGVAFENNLNAKGIMEGPESQDDIRDRTKN